MRKIFIAACVVGVLAVGASSVFVPGNSQNETRQNNEQVVAQHENVVLPIAEYASRRTFNAFGELSQGSIAGYHAADDIEYTDILDEETPVYAIATGVVRRVGEASGYGGVMVISHTIQGQPYGAIYGHIDVSSAGLVAGDRVEKGQFVANLGDHESAETAGERKHLHFGLYKGEETRIQGYEKTPEPVQKWLNPADFFETLGYPMETSSRTYNPAQELGGDTYNIEFLIPSGWEVEYVRAIDALNLYTLSGEGTARERSQIFIRSFDASDFLTLSTVTIYDVQDMVAGQEDYIAKQYVIEKKPEAADFQSQPSWRNERHVATDFRKEPGFTRYYSVAANPNLDNTVFQTVLQSMRIVE